MNSDEAFRDIPGFFRKFKGSEGDGRFDLFCQEFAYSVIYGNLNQSHLNEILELVHLSRTPDRLMLVQTGNTDVFQFYPEFSVMPRRYNMTQLLWQCLRESGLEGMVASFQARDVIGVFLCTGQTQKSEDEAVSNRLESLARKMVSRINTELKEVINIGISARCSRLQQFPQAYAECKEALFHGFRLGRNEVCLYKDITEPKTPFNNDVLKQKMEELYQFVEQEQQEQAEAQVGVVMDYVLSVAISPIKIRLMMVSVADTFVARFYGKGIADAVLEGYYLQAAHQIINSMFAADIHEIMCGLCRDLIRELREETLGKEERLRRKIDEAIEKYYLNSELKLEVMASLFHYSPYHFGRIFTALHGQPFRQYLAEYRVQKAKELLRKGIRLNDVAYQTGFNSISYFCTVFKNVAGMSPMQYQASNAEEEERALNELEKQSIRRAAESTDELRGRRK